MVEMIQRIFRSFEHNNLGALYPPPEGTGFTARVITPRRPSSAVPNFSIGLRLARPVRSSSRMKRMRNSWPIPRLSPRSPWWTLGLKTSSCCGRSRRFLPWPGCVWGLLRRVRDDHPREEARSLRHHDVGARDRSGARRSGVPHVFPETKCRGPYDSDVGFG